MLAQGLALGAACSVDRQEYESRTYTCDVTNPDETACGDGYGCYGTARLLGAPDFCAPRCDPAHPEPHYSCDEGLRLIQCNANAFDVDNIHHCPTGMSCIRADILTGEGVCLPVSGCEKSVDCVDPVRSVCFGEVVKAIYPGRADVKTNRMFCMQAGCTGRGESCAPGTSCLPTVVGQQDLPNLCVPNCDAQKRCPPSFICSAKLVPVGNAFCLPGLLGFDCDSDLDCIVGNCESIDGRKLCTTSCAADADCTPFNNGRYAFFCKQQRCVAPAAFQRMFCQPNAGQSSCPNGFQCASSALLPSGVGLCVSPCPPSRQCADFGGFPRICDLGLCVIPTFGTPCINDQGCVTNLACRQLSTSSAAKFCTIPCATHADCQTNANAGPSSYCVGAVAAGQPFYCAPQGARRAECVDDIQCQSGQCDSGHCTSAVTP